MTLEDAVQAVFWWLVRQPGVAFLSSVEGCELAPCGFRLAIQQLQPTEKRRIFEVRPLDVPDCYEVLEVSVA